MTFAGGLKSFLIVIIVSLVAAVPVRAEDEPAVVKALYDTFAEMGGERPSHDALVTGSDGTITISGLKLLMQNFQQNGEDVRQELAAQKVVIKDVKQLSDGLFEVGAMTLSTSEIKISTPTVDTFRMTAPVMEMRGVIIRSPELIKTALDRWIAQQVLARSVKMPLMTMSIGEWSIDAHDMETTWEGDPATGLGEWIFRLGGVELPPSMLADAGGSPSLSELGYETVVFGMAGTSSIGLEDKFIRMGFDLRFLAREMGAFAVAMSASGIQPALIDAAQAVREAPNSIDISALMSMLQSIKLGHLTLRYDDVSLAERLLNYQQKKEGKSREQLVKEATSVIDFGSTMLNSPELIKQAKDALTTFMTKPGWIQIELRPDTPLSVSRVMALLGTPDQIVKLLNLTITAGAAAE